MMFRLRLLLAVSGMLCFVATATGQHWELRILPDVDSAAFADNFSYQKQFGDSIYAIIGIQEVLQELHREGYLAATVDSITSGEDTLWAYLHQGRQFRWARLGPGNVDEGWLSQTGFREKLYQRKTFSVIDAAEMMDRLVEHAENHGYPFAAVSLKNIQITTNRVEADLHLELNSYIVYDTLEVAGETRTSKKYLEGYLGIKAGEPYNERKVKALQRMLQDLPFIEVEHQPEVIFIPGKAILRLHIKDRPANNLMGVVGVAPNTELKGGILLTGELQFGTYNPFGRGLRFDLMWRKVLVNSQELTIGGEYPFILGTPLSVQGNFDLSKFDTTYIILNSKIKLKYLFNLRNSVYIFYENQSSNLLSTEALSNATVLPDYADVTTRYYGVGAEFERLDYRLNPRRGITGFLEGAGGFKTIRQNPSLNPELYEDTDLASTVYRGQLSAAYYIALGRQGAIKTSVAAGKLFDANALENQLYRIGGFKLLRGFDERSLLADQYVVPSLEYRFLTDRDSYLQVFFDYAWFQNRLLDEKPQRNGYGLGAGYNFRTNAGIFSVSYALGSTSDQDLNFRNGKIHFGLVNVF